jgi:hypothetical protein
VKLLFVDLRRDGAPVSAADLTVAEIGTVRSSTVADGVF